jgi:hypothetical protein
MAALAARGVLTTGFGGSLVRMMTHYGIEEPDIEYALAVTRAVLREL